MRDDEPDFYVIKRSMSDGRLVKIGKASTLQSAREAIEHFPTHILDDVGVYHAVTGRCVLDGISLRK